MIHFIVNANSRSGEGEKIWNNLYKKILASGVEHKVYKTEYAGHAKRLTGLAYAARKTPDEPIVVMGGDGTLNRVLSSFPLDDKPVIGYIPTGSGNDFARGLDYDDNLEHALDTILGEHSYKELDVGEVIDSNGEMRRFVVSSGIGYDAAVCEDINKSKLKTIFNNLHMGKVAFTLLGAKQWITHKRANGVLVLDGKTEVPFKNASFISIHNMKYEGGGYPFAPGAVPDDGKLNICLLATKSKASFFAALVASKKFVGIHGKFKGVELLECETATLKIDKKLTAHADGEILGHFDSMSYRILPKAIRLIY